LWLTNYFLPATLTVVPPPPPRPAALPVVKQARAELSTRRLLDAASDLIGEVGYHGATLALIAQRAGYSHGLVTRRFGSKENLIYALVERMTTTWARRAGNPDPTPLGAAGVGAFLDNLVEGHRRSPAALRGLWVLMFEALNSVPALRDRVAELHRDFRRDVADLVRRSIAAGVVSTEVDPDQVARLLISGVRGAAYQWILDPDEVDLEVALDDLRAALGRMLPPPAPEREESR
jgi:AcrR family transcriptional regulator